MSSLFRQQPKAFYLIFMLELWERFGFYTVNGILAYFLVHNLGFTHKEAFYTFGAFSALVYGLVSVGGFVGDKILGTKRAIVLGMVVLALGYLSLALANGRMIFYALGIICVGNGLFKANPSNLLAKSYKKNDIRLHGAFTLYYMAINIGSIFALFIGPEISARFGWHAAFFFSFIGLSAALINYWFKRHSLSDVSYGPDKEPVSFRCLYGVILAVILMCFVCAQLLQHVYLTEYLLLLIIAVVLVMYFRYMREQQGVARKKMWVAFVLMLEAIVFFTLYQQMPTSLNFFAIHHVRPYFLGILINPQSFQVLNPIWIMIMSPALAYVYMGLHKRGSNMSTAHKFALGMSFCGISFTLLYFSRFFADSSNHVSSWWLVASYFFQSVGELLVSALGVAMVAELVPRAITGFIMGVWFLTSSIAGFTGAFVASLTKPPEGLLPGYETLDIYTHVFLEIGLVTIMLAFVMWLIAPRLSRIISNT